ncbi:hypothetical protein C8R44DRAFT_858245 [Mycena epipterygia]|nr:hypothetical protein C8R44DRAFT_858245 [Mycena epipterygia]
MYRFPTKALEGYFAVGRNGGSTVVAFAGAPDKMRAVCGFRDVTASGAPKEVPTIIGHPSSWAIGCLPMYRVNGLDIAVPELLPFDGTEDANILPAGSNPQPVEIIQTVLSGDGDTGSLGSKKEASKVTNPPRTPRAHYRPVEREELMHQPVIFKRLVLAEVLDLVLSASFEAVETYRSSASRQSREFEPSCMKNREEPQEVPGYTSKSLRGFSNRVPPGYEIW